MRDVVRDDGDKPSEKNFTVGSGEQEDEPKIPTTVENEDKKEKKKTGYSHPEADMVLAYSTLPGKDLLSL